jgi:hypothetical protein
MKCEDLLKLLNEYVDGTAEVSLCAEFERHLAGCNPCQVVVDNIRKTIRLYKDGQRYDLPPQLLARLQDALRARWAARLSQPSQSDG